MGKQLKGSSYSLMVDESTDISTTKQLCIEVRFLNSAENKIATTLLDLVELSDGTAQTLHDTVMKTLDKHGLPVKNCLGLCTDGANSMSGNHNSLFSRLREDNKELVLVKCACHSLDLVASKLMQAIPSAVEHLTNAADPLVVFQELENLYLEVLRRMLHPSVLRHNSTASLLSLNLVKIKSIFLQPEVADLGDVFRE
ncbi:zinc finger MYM-type protein 6-like [Rhipicephalus sanguineus]|uniref:zinc finger MYM-type protein 6-like n=1 Tax=Rhipicephalus sanguineus TaxID=34632 RepID=UPI0018935435|nr:zinc finger MYM-type protein 6-like [Rhipicephalus sanguineus]